VHNSASSTSSIGGVYDGGCEAALEERAPEAQHLCSHTATTEAGIFKMAGFFVAAAFFEIAGCFAFWSYFRPARPAWTLGLGVVSLVLFAYALTRVDAAFAGRAYARTEGSTSLLHLCGSGSSKVPGLTDGI